MLKLRITGLDFQFIGEFKSEDELESFLENLAFVMTFPDAFSYDQMKQRFLFVLGDSNIYENLNTFWNWSYAWDRHLRDNRKNKIYFPKKDRKNIGSGNFSISSSKELDKGPDSFANWNSKVWKKRFKSYFLIGKLSREKSLKLLFKWIKRDVAKVDEAGWREDAMVFLNNDDLNEAISLGLLGDDCIIKFKGVDVIPPGKYLIAKSNWHRMCFSGALEERKFLLEEGEKYVWMCCSPHLFCASGSYLKKTLKLGYFLWQIWRLVQKKFDFEITS